MSGAGLRKLQKWTERPVGQPRPRRSRGNPVVEVREAVMPTPTPSFSEVQEYVMEFRSSVHYTVDLAEHPDAGSTIRENAAMQMLHQLYAPIEEKLREAITLLSADDVEAVHACLCETIDMIYRDE